jgi:hypothetical protein
MDNFRKPVVSPGHFSRAWANPGISAEIMRSICCGIGF